jgi:hypothetical protein
VVSRADAVFGRGTMGELAGVVWVVGGVIGAGTMGPVTARLSGLFRALTEREGEVVA